MRLFVTQTQSAFKSFCQPMVKMRCAAARLTQCTTEKMLPQAL
jgi:hypothetical protein